MAWEIAPNSTIKLYENVPLDSTYEHSIFFVSESEQNTYFHSTLTPHRTYSSQSYQRYERGTIRVEELPDNLYACNYMAFQNTSFGNKWFYAFVTGVNYVSNYVAEVQYEIDVLQTYFFDYTLEESFIVRQHSFSDGLYENLVPENLELGDTPVCVFQNEFDMNDMRLCIITSERSPSWIPNVFPIEYKCTTALINGVYCPLTYYYNLKFDNSMTPGGTMTWLDFVKDFINGFVDQGYEDKVLSIFQYPAFMSESGGVPVDPTAVVPARTIVNASPRSDGLGRNIDNLDGYQPKNKKLFSYPYSYFNVSNNSGNVSTFHYEDWDSDYYRCEFKVSGVFFGANPTLLAYPTHHRHIDDDYDSGLTYSNFPQCPWVGDVYKCYMAQHGNQMAMSLVSGILGSATPNLLYGKSINSREGFDRKGKDYNTASTGVRGNLSFNPVNAGLRTVDAIGNYVAKVSDLHHVPPQVHGQFSNDTLNIGLRKVKISFYNMSIKRQFAERIDGYFSKFGYAQHVFATPSRYARPHWTYIQTQGCNVTSIHMPSSAVEAICSIYDKGITFWRHPSEVGDYTLDNSPSQV